MRVIQTDDIFRIYGDSLKVYNQIPIATYVVRFTKLQGFFLEQRDNLVVAEKAYGVHDAKAHKIIDSFSAFDRNLGVLLSGDKGIGKSMFARTLSVLALEKGIPIILVDTAYTGISDYLSSIKQEVMVLFDEFDKVFAKKDDDDAQASLLTLFDGTDNGKKLFVITCNDIHKINDFIVNRPGRFHYHIRFAYPTPEEIEVYMKDHLDEQYYGEIRPVVEFSIRTDLNYDCLRSIAFEINRGLTFKEAIQDLNIVCVEDEKYNIDLVYSNGVIANVCNAQFNMMSSDIKSFWLDFHGTCNSVQVGFVPNEAKFDVKTGTYFILGNSLTLYYDDDDLKKKMEEIKPVELRIRRRPRKDYRYAV